MSGQITVTGHECFVFIFFVNECKLFSMGYIQNCLNDQVFERSVNIIKMQMWLVRVPFSLVSVVIWTGMFLIMSLHES
jgi:hypothetical protein